MLCRAPARALTAVLPRWRVGSARSFAEDAAQLVDLSLYPIDQLGTETGDDFARACRDELDANGILVLRDFLRREAVEAFLAEEQQLHSKGSTSHVQYSHSTEFNTADFES